MDLLDIAGIAAAVALVGFVAYRIYQGYTRRSVAQDPTGRNPSGHKDPDKYPKP